MATQRPTPSSDAATKQRIINHMNTDHSTSLTDFLQHYSRLPPSLAATAELVDISLTQLTISSRSSPTATTTTYIPIRPSPMASYADARDRMVYMHHEALEGLGKSPLVVDVYVPPRTPVQWLTFLGVCLGYYGFSFRSNFEPGAAIHDYLLAPFPTFAALCARFHFEWLFLMLLIHVAEAVHMARGRLRRHQTPRFGGVWWMWVVGTFFEGFGSFLRFDQAVEGVREKRAKATH
ncbi:uncharacterized protein H6S33_002829 [Morchella sextelata]|uniref:uncharacterized protein n=1 Tax=Morchella sextelata TaxID=1174677 RepID=UPI001D0536EF|nr:uncharacterized protein H6S33_002829 [Morchella sextelata]KAH0607795.1 hypothetical protein H6S33_002829 [Morchella sextelata]